MKKFIFCLFCIFLFASDVYANEWNTDVLEGDNVLKEYRYRFYKEEKRGEYTKIDDDRFEYMELNDFYYGDDIYYDNDCPSYVNEGDRTYLTKYKYKKYLPIRYVKMCNLSDSEMDIESIEFYDEVIGGFFSSEIKECTKCQNDNYTIEPGGCLTLEMEYPLYLNEFTIWLNLANNGNYGTFELLYSNDIDYSNKHIVGSVRGTMRHSIYQYNYTYTMYPNFTEVYTNYDIDVDDLTIVLEKHDLCMAKDILIYKYNIVKDYYDDNYYSNIDDLVNLSLEEKLLYKKDVDDYKIFYKYNDKQIINDIKNNNTLDSELKLVKTGYYVKNYDYLIIYMLVLLLILLLCIKRLKRMSSKKNI